MTLDEILRGVPGSLPGDTYARSAALAYAYAGRLDDAIRNVALVVDPNGRRLLTVVVEGFAGDRSAAIATLRARVDAAPDDFDSLVWLVRILRSTRDPLGEHYAEQTRILRRDEAEAASINDRPTGEVQGYPFAIYSRKGQIDPWPPQVLIIGAIPSS